MNEPKVAMPKSVKFFLLMLSIVFFASLIVYAAVPRGGMFHSWVVFLLQCELVVCGLIYAYYLAPKYEKE